MRRFAKAFLTTSAALVLVVNLVMILLYGRQFYACPGTLPDQTVRSLCGAETEPTFLPIVLLNFVVVGTLVLIWLAIRHFVHVHRESS